MRWRGQTFRIPYLDRRRGQSFKAHECLSALSRAQCIPHAPFTPHNTARFRMNAPLSDHHQQHYDCSLHPYASLSASYFCDYIQTEQTLLSSALLNRYIIHWCCAMHMHALAKCNPLTWKNKETEMDTEMWHHEKEAMMSNECCCNHSFSACQVSVKCTNQTFHTASAAYSYLHKTNLRLK